MSGNPNPTPVPTIFHVRRAQKAISDNFRGESLSRYLDMTSIRGMSGELGRLYFPTTYKKNFDRTMAQVEEIYRAALVLAPYLQRLRGTYRPSWNKGTLLSWFRRSVSSATQQFFFCHIPIEEAPSHEKAVENAQALLGIADTAFLRETFSFLDNLSRSDGMKSKLAQLFYYPMAFAHIDQDYRETTRFDAIPRDRNVLRVMKKGTASYLRKGRDIYMVASRHCKQRIDGPTWIDLRETSVDVMEYRIKFQKAGEKEGVRIEIQPGHLDFLKAQVKAVLVSSKMSPEKKVYVINKTMVDFAKRHRYAAGSREQLNDLDKALYRLIKSKLGTHYPQFKEQLWSVKGHMHTKLVLPMVNPFLSPETVSDNTWMSLWSPYR